MVKKYLQEKVKLTLKIHLKIYKYLHFLPSCQIVFDLKFWKAIKKNFKNFVFDNSLKEHPVEEGKKKEQ